jgi:hypothetical protein
MKKYLFAATMLAAAVSTPAFADGNNRGTDTETFTLRANNPPKCNLESSDYTLAIDSNALSNDEGRALRSVSRSVADALNAENVTAWCTGAKNTLQMYRTAFVADGTNGNQLPTGFNTAVIYDVTMNIADAVRSDGFSPIEGTSDGKGRGPGVGGAESVGRFGPSGRGSQVRFRAELPSEAVTDGAEGDQARNLFSEDNNRLIAGRYESTLTIELTPGN